MLRRLAATACCFTPLATGAADRWLLRTGAADTPYLVGGTVLAALGLISLVVRPDRSRSM